MLILFPEGTRTRDGRVGRFRPGVGSLVAGRSIPVVPCWLQGTYAAWPAQRRLPRPGKLHLTVGPPLMFPDAGADRAAMLMIADACEAAVRALAATHARYETSSDEPSGLG